MPRTKDNACSGKVRHANRVSAIITMKRMRNKGLSVYRCPYCGGWHVGTSRSPWKQQARLDQLLGRH